jgi:hypothetical protein
MLSLRTVLPGSSQELFQVVPWWVALLHQGEDWLARWLWQLRRLSCWLVRRHDEFMQFEKNRLSLKCISCGHETPGWVLDRKTPLIRFPAERRLTQDSRVSERRVA